MRDSGFSLFSENFRVQMNEAAGDTEANRNHLMVAESRSVEVIVERAELVVVSDEPELGARVTRCHVRSDVAEDVFVAQQYSAIDFRFALPRFFIATEENFYRDILAMPNCSPNFTVTSTSDAFRKSHLASKGSLNEQRKPTARSRSHRLVEVFLQINQLSLKCIENFKRLTLNVLSPQACDLFNKSSVA